MKNATQMEKKMSYKPTIHHFGRGQWIFCGVNYRTEKAALAALKRWIERNQGGK